MSKQKRMKFVYAQSVPARVSKARAIVRREESAMRLHALCQMWGLSSHDIALLTNQDNQERKSGASPARRMARRVQSGTACDR